jgi:hypothetical protein
MAQAIDGDANVIAAAICKTTNNQPAAACAAPGSPQPPPLSAMAETTPEPADTHST